MRNLIALVLLTAFPTLSLAREPVRVVWENTSYMPDRYEKPLLFAVGRNGQSYRASTGSPVVGGGDSLYLRSLGPDGRMLWEYDYTGSQDDSDNVCTDLEVDPWGNAIIAGMNRANWATLKIAPDGRLLWDRRVDVIGKPLDAALDRAGNVIVAGEYFGGYSTPDIALTVKYSPEGDALWTVTAPQAAGAWSVFSHVRTDPEGNVFAGMRQQKRGLRAKRRFH